MDPEAALKKIREACDAYRAARELGNNREALMHADNVADAFDALDGWLSRGGFVPKAWEHEKPGLPRLDFVNNRGE